jgi:N-acetylneuraminic acid mutarotase
MRTHPVVVLGLAIAFVSACGSRGPSGPLHASPGPSTTPPSSSPPSNAPPSPSRPKLGGSWAAGPPVPQPLGEVAAAVLDGRLYVAGGFAEHRLQSRAFYRFDPGTNAWTELAPLPEARDHAALTALGGALYLTGGNAEGLARRANLWRYDPASDGWSALRSMPDKRSAHAAVAVGGTLYVIGGVIPSQTLHAPTWRFDPATGDWATDLAELPTYREHLAAVALDDGTILAIGGRAATDLGAVERYNPATDTWTALPPLPTPRGGLTAALLGGAVHALGGESIENPRVFPQHEVLDLTTLTWAAAPPLDRGRHGLGSGVIDGRWYVAAGGAAPDLAVSDRLDVFTP